MAGVGRFLSFSGSLYKPWLKFRVCAETPRSGLANHHTLALACTGKTGQIKTFPQDKGGPEATAILDPLH
jgi:hypothetical protein